MRISRTLWFLSAAFVAGIAVVSIALYSYGFVAAHLVDSCAHVNSLAKNNARVAYLRSWVADRMADTEELPRIYRTGFEAASLAAVGLDLSFFRYYPDGVGLTPHLIDRDRPSVPDNIQAVSFHHGRNAIIIVTEKFDVWAARDEALTGPTTRALGEGVRVRCGFEGPG